MAFCASCGQQVESNQQFCIACGAPVQEATASQKLRARAQRKPVTTAQKASGCGCLTILVITIGIVIGGLSTSSPISPTTPVSPGSANNFGPSADLTSCAVSEVIPTTPPAKITLVMHSDSSSPSRTCSKPLTSGSSWADPSVPGLMRVCTTDDGNETSQTYTDGRDAGAIDLAKGICTTMQSQGATVTYP